MPERTEYAPGTPSWVDIQTSDPDAAKRFYGALFGWEYDDRPVPQGGVYSMAQIRGRNVAAVAPLPPGQEVPPHWNSYVTVADVDATAARVADTGGTLLMPPFDVMDAGRMALVQDPTGGVVALWQAKNDIGAQLVNEHGSLCWNELHTPDVATASAFYSQLLGWQPTAMPDMGEYRVFMLGENGIAGAMPPAVPGMPAAWLVYFAVDDAEAAVATAKQLGGTVLAEPTDIPVGRMAMLADPQGAVFAIIRLAQQPS